VTNFLVRISGKVLKRKDLLFSIAPAKQKSFMNRLECPGDDIDRGYCQYRCQMKLLGKSLALLYNMASIPLIVIYKKTIPRPNKEINKKVRVPAIFMYDGDNSILPLSLKDKYNVIQIRDFQRRMCLTASDKSFLKELRKRYPLSFHFYLKCMLKVAMYRYQFIRNNPEIVIVSEEYSFTSSVLTKYCESNGVKHFNVMHGEKLYYMRDSFFHFHECYVWDEHYKMLFIDLNAEPSQFIIEMSPCWMSWNQDGVEKSIDYTYYLGAEQTKTLIKIKQSLAILLHAGAKVAIRPHPIYSSVKEVQRIFDKEEGYIIETKDDVPIKNSILRTRHAVSCYSTVLIQAINNGVRAVLDDVTDRNKFERLKELGYICMKKEHSLLSGVLSGRDN